MGTASGNQLPVGLRYVQIYQLVASGSASQLGLPAASGSSVYEGLQIVGGKAFTLTVPDARIITHIGDDRILAQDVLPPQETMTAELRAARSDYDVFALLTNTNVITVGESKLVGISTDQQGYEDQLGLLMYQQSLDASTGARNWRTFICPKARLVPKPQGMQDQASEVIFQVLPFTVKKHLWGTSFVLGTEGFTEAAFLEMQTENKPWLASWKGDAATTVFSFHADRPAIAVAKIHGVWVNGVKKTLTSDYTQTVAAITFLSPPAVTDYITCLYELAS